LRSLQSISNYHTEQTGQCKPVHLERTGTDYQARYHVPPVDSVGEATLAPQMAAIDIATMTFVRRLAQSKTFR
jgi:hypothetical protein